MCGPASRQSKHDIAPGTTNHEHFLESTRRAKKRGQKKASNVRRITKLKKRKNEKGWTDDDIAEKLGRDRTTVGRIFREGTAMDDVAKKIDKLLGGNYDDLNLTCEKIAIYGVTEALNYIRSKVMEDKRRDLSAPDAALIDRIWHRPKLMESIRSGRIDLKKAEIQRLVNETKSEYPDVEWNVETHFDAASILTKCESAFSLYLYAYGEITKASLP